MPVLTIFAQILFGVAFGFVGVLLASPLTVVIVILVRMIYVEHILGGKATSSMDSTGNIDNFQVETD